ncbi:cupin domain-containing protein [Paracoccus ravus]|uniref:cupin domain-containing protein n=1 Tax=Paracoccus ravus TaxID=2447760 RepID=UPI001FD6CDED|nr:cupin domain-containing protein [Paracoccus ravus]
MPHDHDVPRWKHDGIRVIKGDQLDPNTAQTSGMFRQAAINHARVGAQKIWAGTVAIEPDAKTGVHHHGPLESVIYVLRGKARLRWGERLEFVAEAGPGDFIYVPPYVPHQEINADPSRFWNASSCDRTMRRSWSISPMSIPSSRPKPSIGSIPSIPRQRPEKCLRAVEQIPAAARLEAA